MDTPSREFSVPFSGPCFGTAAPVVGPVAAWGPARLPDRRPECVGRGAGPELKSTRAPSGLTEQLGGESRAHGPVTVDGRAGTTSGARGTRAHAHTSSARRDFAPQSSRTQRFRTRNPDVPCLAWLGLAWPGFASLASLSRHAWLAWLAWPCLACWTGLACWACLACWASWLAWPADGLSGLLARGAGGAPAATALGHRDKIM